MQNDLTSSSPKYWDPADTPVIEVLIDVLQGTSSCGDRHNIAWYVDLCRTAGFCNTSDQVKACAERYIAGKRKISPPGTRRKARDEKRRKEEMRNAPPELLAAVMKTLSENVVATTQYKAGVEKAINSLVGGVMRQYKADPAVIKQLLIANI